MEKNILHLFYSISIILLIILTLGCLQDGQNNYNSSNLFVDDDFTKDTPGWMTTHFARITAAINNSSDNQTIYVSEGVYYENILLEKSIHLRGENAHTTIIDGMHEDTVIEVTGHGVINITGFTIQNCSTEEREHAGIDLRSSGNRIQSNIFRWNNNGIYSRYSDENIISMNLFVNNTEYGAYLHTSSNSNNITENVFLNNTYGLRIKGSEYCTVSYNIFKHNEKIGLYLCCGANDNTVVHNSFIDNPGKDADDSYFNIWDNGAEGNYWDTYHLLEQGAYDNNSDGIIDSTYENEHIKNDDKHPLKEPPLINNPFYSTEELLRVKIE